MKSTRLHAAARTILLVGFFACLAGCGIYAVLCLPETIDLVFEWRYPAITGVAFLVCLLISVILGAAGKRAAKREAIEARMLEEALLAKARERAEAAAAKKAAEEQARAEEEARKAAEAKANTPSMLRRIKACAKPTAALAVEAGKVLIPVVTVLAISSAVRKSRQRKKQAQNRQAFYRWLG